MKIYAVKNTVNVLKVKFLKISGLLNTESSVKEKYNQDKP